MKCPDCNGLGLAGMYRADTCDRCEGTGRLPAAPAPDAGERETHTQRQVRLHAEVVREKALAHPAVVEAIAAARRAGAEAMREAVAELLHVMFLEPAPHGCEGHRDCDCSPAEVHEWTTLDARKRIRALPLPEAPR